MIRDVLKEYLPKRYSLGTGFVIDSKGNRSRQCDIIIYDSIDNITLFERSGPLFFPVETVYAVLEIKTTLDSAEVADACNHIASVKTLVSNAPFSYEWEPNDDGTVNYVKHKPTPPLGIVFGYQSDTRKVSTIKSRFERSLAQINDVEHHPDLIVSLTDACVIRYKDLIHTVVSPEFMFFPLVARNIDGSLMRVNGQFQIIGPEASVRPVPEAVYVGEVNGYQYNSKYKVCHDDAQEGPEVLADAPRLLLMTLLIIDKLLKLKRLPRANLTSYVTNYYGEGMLR